MKTVVYFKWKVTFSNVRKCITFGMRKAGLWLTCVLTLGRSSCQEREERTSSSCNRSPSKLQYVKIFQHYPGRADGNHHFCHDAVSSAESAGPTHGHESVRLCVSQCLLFEDQTPPSVAPGYIGRKLVTVLLTWCLDCCNTCKKETDDLLIVPCYSVYAKITLILGFVC
jgi:hypothetical protein